MRTKDYFDNMKPSFLFFTAVLCVLSVAFSFSGCGKKQPAAQSTDAREFGVRGIVRGVDAANATLTIEHEDVPGFMPAMTMPFTMKNVNELDGLKLGDGVTFQLVVMENNSWITDVKYIDAGVVKLPGNRMNAASAPVFPAQTARLNEGDSMPDFTLTDQNNRRIDRSVFAGKPLLITFIFTRCPLPDFCPRMTENFGALLHQIEADPALAGKARLLSISFDPEHDTPEVLAQHARLVGSDGEQWRFATGAPAEVEKLTRAFSVYAKAEGGSISHGLCTALVDDEGTIRKIWRGNGWTPNEVMNELKRLLAAEKSS